MLDCGPIMLDCRPIMLDCRPIMLDCRPIMLDCRPIMLDCRPIMLDFSVSRATHLEPVCHGHACVPILTLRLTLKSGIFQF